MIPTKPDAFLPRDQTVFVLGAGASKELGLPTGPELVNRIVDFLAPSREERDIRALQQLEDALGRTNPAGPHDMANARRTLCDGLRLVRSIDAFLHIHQDMPCVVELGKALVALFILRAERDSHLFSRSQQNSVPQPNWDALSQTWLPRFFALLAEGCRRRDMPERLARVSFIVFNYDRCLEEFLQLALVRSSFISTHEEAAKLVRTLNIIHPYGEVGVIGKNGSNGVPFGDEPNADQLVRASRALRTFGEQPSGADITERMHLLLSKARRVVFLGFGFLNMNMRLLAQSKRTEDPQDYFATRFGISDDDSAFIRRSLDRDMPGKRMNIRIGDADERCCDLFDNLQRTLGFG